MSGLLVLTFLAAMFVIYVVGVVKSIPFEIRRRYDKEIEEHKEQYPILWRRESDIKRYTERIRNDAIFDGSWAATLWPVTLPARIMTGRNYRIAFADEIAADEAKKREQDYNQARAIVRQHEWEQQRKFDRELGR